MAEGKDLLQVLWSGADVLRGKMDANEYKTYLLGLVFIKSIWFIKRWNTRWFRRSTGSLWGCNE